METALFYCRLISTPTTFGFCYFLTFVIIAILFVRTQTTHKNTMIQLRIKYSRGK